MDEPPYSPVAPLSRAQIRTGFDCGSAPLNDFITRYALQNQERGMVRNYVTTRTGTMEVAGFYTLVVTEVEQKRLPARIVKGLGRSSIPAMLLARLAIDLREQGRGLGLALLKDAVLRTQSASQIAGLKLLLVHAKDEQAAAFYLKHGFDSLSDDPNVLFQPVPVGG